MNVFSTLSFLLVAAVGAIAIAPHSSVVQQFSPQKETLFTIQAVDTMKVSRDQARRTLQNPLLYKNIIDKEVWAVKELGATHISIGTPYDSEFLPVIKLWVDEARKNNLSVWFRGNFSGWEGWFGYKKIDKEKHLALTEQFILENPDLFRDGDVFTPCPECENGGPGDPRMTGDVEGYKNFLIEERNASLEAFKKIGKKVQASYPSMNGDVARLIMDTKTTQALGGVVVVDHYVRSIEQFEKDIEDFRLRSNGKIALGEIGAPVPDLNGPMTPVQQEQYITGLFEVLYKEHKNIAAINYWVLSDGSTALLNADGSRRPVFDVVKQFFSAKSIAGTIKNEVGDTLSNMPITVQANNKEYRFLSNEDGTYQIFVPFPNSRISVGGGEYKQQELLSNALTQSITKDVVVQPESPSLLYKVGYIFLICSCN